MQTGTPKMRCCKHGGSRVKLSLWPFCGPIQDLPIQFGQVNFNPCGILLVGLGGPTLMQKTMT